MHLSAVLTIAGLTSESGGPSRSVPALAAALASSGVRVQIVTLDFGSRESAPLIPEAERVTTHLVRCRTSRRVPTLWARRFRSILEKAVMPQSTTVVHDNGAWLPTNYLAANVARHSRCPLIISPRGMLSPWSLQFKALRKQIAWLAFQRRVLKSAGVLHVTSNEEAADLRALGFRQPIAVIPNGVTMPEWQASSRPKGERTLLFLSRIHPKKGLTLLAEAWAALRPEGWRVVVAGQESENHLQQLRASLRAGGIEKQFHFPGPVDGAEKQELYRNSDLFVLPSFHENFGIVVAEALAAGLPVITTRSTPWRDLETWHCGWWVDPNPAALAEALGQAINLSDGQRQEMGMRGRGLVQNRFAWPAIAQEVRLVYEWILGKGPKPISVNVS